MDQIKRLQQSTYTLYEPHQHTIGDGRSPKNCETKEVWQETTQFNTIQEWDRYRKGQEPVEWNGTTNKVTRYNDIPKRYRLYNVCLVESSEETLEVN
jgi:hypothetical protein